MTHSSSTLAHSGTAGSYVVDPQGNVATLGRAVRGARTVLLTGPIDPDGDSIGACLALARGIRAISSARVDVAGAASFRYAWMPDAHTMKPDHTLVSDGEPYDLVVVLDGDKRRLSDPVGAAFKAARRRAIIDHHGSTRASGYDIALIDRDSASTCGMVHDVLVAWGVALDADLAALLYTGLIFDTGGFRHSNTSPATHQLAAALLQTGIDHAAITTRVLMERRPNGLRLMGQVLTQVRFACNGRVAHGAVSFADMERLHAVTADLEGIVDALLYTRDVEVACLFIEKQPGMVKLSLRSRRSVDVARLAAQLAPGGGGHARAAGVMIEDPLDTVLSQVPAVLCEAVERAATAG